MVKPEESNVAKQEFSQHFLQVTLPFGLLFLFSSAVHLYFGNSFSVSSCLVGFFLFSGLGISIGFHRLLSHRSFQCSPLWVKVLSVLGSMAGQGSPIFWKALHMGLHHPHSDHELDIHSPQKGFWWAFMGWQIYLKPGDVPFLAARELLTDPFQKFLHKHYNFIFWTPILLGLALNFEVAYSLLILPIFISMYAENFINSFCHIPSFGYRNFETNDQSVNIPILGYFLFGQGWHNNHHRFPKRYNYGGQRFFEFDVCALIIPLIATKRTETNASR